MRWSRLPALPAVLLLAALLGPAGLPGSGAAVAGAGCASASAADFDGDGVDDAVAGDPFATVAGKVGAGVVQVLRGGGQSGGIVLRAPDAAPGDGFGWSVRTAHLDGDRCLDVIIGAPYADREGVADAGAAYVVYGAPAGAPRMVRLATDPERDTHFGWSLAAAELPDGDGGLIAVGAPHADSDGVLDSGAVHLFRVGEAVEPLDTITQDSDGVIGNSEPGDMFGWALALGHLGGVPAELDLAVGAPYENNDGTGRQLSSGQADTGGVVVVFDVKAAAGRYPSVKWELRQAGGAVPERPGDRFGYALDYAEWNGDGYLAAIAPLADAGAPDSGVVQLFVRRGGGTVAPLGTVPARSGWSVAFWDRNGRLSLALGSPYRGRGPEAGVVSSVAVSSVAVSSSAAGSGASSDRSPAAVVGGDTAYGHLGASIADLAGDPLAAGSALIVGAPDRGLGAVLVVGRGGTGYRGPGGLDGGGSADFGASVAG